MALTVLDSEEDVLYSGAKEEGGVTKTILFFWLPLGFALNNLFILEKMLKLHTSSHDEYTYLIIIFR
jgi:hypothetical protein